MFWKLEWMNQRKHLPNVCHTFYVINDVYSQCDTHSSPSTWMRRVKATATLCLAANRCEKGRDLKTWKWHQSIMMRILLFTIFGVCIAAILWNPHISHTQFPAFCEQAAKNGFPLLPPSITILNFISQSPSTNVTL